MTLPPLAHAERQAWLTRVRDALNERGVMVSACDLSRRKDVEVADAYRWASQLCPDWSSPPGWLRPFEDKSVWPAPRDLKELRIRARAELAAYRLDAEWMEEE